MTNIHSACLDTYTDGGQYGCESAKIDSFDGLAIGVYFTTNSDSTAFTNGSALYDGESFALCFDNESCLGAYFAPYEA